MQNLVAASHTSWTYVGGPIFVGGGGLEPADQYRVASDPKETPPSPRVVTNLVALGNTVLV